MTTFILIPAAEAAVFTLGFALIHSQQRNAELLAEILIVLAVIAISTIVFIVASIDVLNKATLSETLNEVEAFIPSFE